MTGPQPTRVERALGLLVVIIVGAVLLAVGLLGALYQLEHPPTDKHLVYLFVGIALLGALLLPSVFTALFPRVKQIFVLVFPGGLPFLGRRADDPPGTVVVPPPPPPNQPPQPPGVG